MGLEADTVDLDTGILNELDDPPSTVRLCFVVLEIVVVVVQLRLWINLRGELERENQEFFADCVVPH